MSLMNRYAQINAENICCAETYSSGVVEGSDIILLSDTEASPLRMLWENGKWVVPPPKPLP